MVWVAGADLVRATYGKYVRRKLQHACPSGEVEVDEYFTTDSTPGDASWVLTSIIEGCGRTGRVVESRSAGSFTRSNHRHHEEICLPDGTGPSICMY